MKPFLTAKIVGHVYRFFYVRKIDDDDSSGECDTNENKIKIRKGMAKTAEGETLFHEVTHALHPGWKEDRVQAYAAQMYQTLNENPKLLKRIFPKHFPRQK